MAFDDGYYFGLCKIICISNKIYDEGKTVTVINDDNSYTSTIINGRAEFDVPNRQMYTVTLFNGSEAEYSTKVCVGYGECIKVSLAKESEPLYKGDIDSYTNLMKNRGDFMRRVPSGQALLGMNIRYNQENDYVQIFSDGEWHNLMPGGFHALDLYTTSNLGEFVAFGGNSVLGSDISIPTITFNGGMKIKAMPNGIGCVISRKVNVSEFTRLKFTASASTGTSVDQYIKVYLSSSKGETMTPVLPNTIVSGAEASYVGDKNIDVSSLHGEYYVVFEVKRSNESGSFADIDLSNIRFTN